MTFVLKNISLNMIEKLFKIFSIIFTINSKLHPNNPKNVIKISTIIIYNKATCSLKIESTPS